MAVRGAARTGWGAGAGLGCTGLVRALYGSGAVSRECTFLLNHAQSQWGDRKGVRTMRDTRNGRVAKTKEDSELPGVWVAYGTLLQHLRRQAELSQQALGAAIGYSLEQVASVEQGRRPAKGAFTVAAERVLAAGGVLEVLQSEVDRAKLPRFFRNFALIEAEVLSRFSYDPLLVPGLLQTEAYARAVFMRPLPAAQRGDRRPAHGGAAQPPKAADAGPVGGAVVHHRGGGVARPGGRGRGNAGPVGTPSGGQQVEEC